MIARRSRDTRTAAAVFGLAMLVTSLTACRSSAPRGTRSGPGEPATAAQAAAATEPGQPVTVPVATTPAAVVAPAPSTTTPRAAPAVAAAPATSGGPRTVATAASAATTTTVEPLDVAAVADELARTEAVIRDPAASPDEVAAAGRDQQLAYRIVAAHPDQAGAVEAAAPAPLRAAIAANSDAVLELGKMVGRLRDAPPAWQIVPPPPAEELLADYKGAAQSEGVPWQVLAAIHLVETRMGRIRGLSSAGAQGPMQFMPATWAQYGQGGNVEDSHDAIYAAARLLRRNGGDRGDLRAALYSYNRSQHYVNAVLAYADVMKADERAYLGYHAWQVWYRTSSGDVLLPEGYGS